MTISLPAVALARPSMAVKQPDVEAPDSGANPQLNIPPGNLYVLYVTPAGDPERAIAEHYLRALTDDAATRAASRLLGTVGSPGQTGELYDAGTHALVQAGIGLPTGTCRHCQRDIIFLRDRWRHVPADGSGVWFLRCRPGPEDQCAAPDEDPAGTLSPRAGAPRQTSPGSAAEGVAGPDGMAGSATPDETTGGAR